MQTQSLYDDAPYETRFAAKVIAIREHDVALDRTLFYPTGGGQPGDVGQIVLADGSSVKVLGTQRDLQLRDLIWHQLEATPSGIAIDMPVEGVIDWQPRFQHMRMHTCLHLLCSLVDAPVTGCSIGQDKGRLDFDLPEMTLDKVSITESLNRLVAQGLDVRTYWSTPAEVATALQLTRTAGVAPPTFGGKLRMVELPGVDIQPCGGTHVRNTREIGSVVCDKIEKKSAHNRRVAIRFA